VFSEVYIDTKTKVQSGRRIVSGLKRVFGINCLSKSSFERSNSIHMIIKFELLGQRAKNDKPFFSPIDAVHYTL